VRLGPGDGPSRLTLIGLPVGNLLICEVAATMFREDRAVTTRRRPRYGTSSEFTA
jgi:hypothetical protein